MVAFSFVHGSVNLNNLTEESLKDPQILAFTDRIKIEQTQEDTPGIPLGDLKVIVELREQKEI